MKKIMRGNIRFYGWILFGHTVLMCSSCNMNSLEKAEEIRCNVDYVERTFDISLESLTKTVLEEGGRCTWKKGDIIRYWSESGASGQFQIDENSEDCVIQTYLPVADTAIFAMKSSFDVYDCNFETGGAYARMSNASLVTDGSFDQAHSVIAYGKISDGKLSFSNANNIIRFQLNRDDVRRVVFYANLGEAICSDTYWAVGYSGAYMADGQSVDFHGGELWTLGKCGSMIIADISGAGTFYLPALIFQSLYGGFTIDLYGAEDVYIGSVRSLKKMEMANNTIMNLGVLDQRIQNIDLLVQVSAPNEEDENDSNLSTVYYASRGGLRAKVTHDHRSNADEIAGYTYETTITADGLVKDDAIQFRSNASGDVVCVCTKNKVLIVNYSDNGSSVHISDVTDFAGESSGRKSFTAENYQRQAQTLDWSAYDGTGANPSEVFSYYSCASAVLDFMKFLSTTLDDDEDSKIMNQMVDLLPDGMFKDVVSLSMDGLSLFGAVMEKSKSKFLSGLAIFIGSSLMIFPRLINEHQDTTVNRIFGDAAPITGNVEMLSNNSVRISCAVSHYVKGNIGILICDGNSYRIIKNNQLALDYTEMKEGTSVYSFEFNNLEVGKKYKYRAFIVPISYYEELGATSGLVVVGGLDFFRYGSVSEFTMCLYPEQNLEYVKIGGVYWACCDLGASTPEQVGPSFAQGEKSSKDSFTESNYVGDWTTKGKGSDVATNILGNGWRTPTTKEFYFLINNNKVVRETINGVVGVRITGNDGKSIFMAGYEPEYWSSDFFCDYPIYGARCYKCWINKKGKEWYSSSFASSVYCGYRIRPVRTAGY